MAADHDDYVRVEELPDLLRSYGVLPNQQRTVPAGAARTLLAAFDLDTECLALIAALDEFTDQRYERARVTKLAGAALSEFNVKHPRGGDGKFATTAGRVLQALGDWNDSGRKGDPLQGFSQAQLAKVAKARKLPVSKNADRGEISKALLADMGRQDVRPRPQGADPDARSKPGSLLDTLRNATASDRKKITERLNAASREELADAAAKLDTVKKPTKSTSRKQLIDGILEGTVGFRERAEAIGGFGKKGEPVGLRDTAKPSARTVETDAAQILGRLQENKKVRADPSTIDDLMKRITADGTVFNLANLNVAGRGNGNLFQKHLRDRPRETMPQLPTETGADMDRFMDYLAGKGVGFEFGTIDPRKLVASQSELSGPKVAKLYGFMNKDGWKPGGTIIVSRDGAVIDGHHRWAASAAASIARGGTMDVTVMIIDADLDDILGTEEKPDGIVMGFAKFESLATDREG